MDTDFTHRQCIKHIQGLPLFAGTDVVLGAIGSLHCIGMCGPIVLLIERDGAGIGRRLAANVGRLGFYVVLGGIAAAFGVFLTSFTGVSEGLFMLRTAAGVIIILLGLHLLFDLRLVGWLEKVGSSLWQRMSPFAKHVMPANTIARSLGAGFIWGALPCGLVYSAVVLAATAGGASGGARHRAPRTAREPRWASQRDQGVT